MSVFDRVYRIRAGKFRRYHGEGVVGQLKDPKTLLFNIRDFFVVIFSILRSLILLARIKPDVVFSKGSFVAVPVGLAAWMRHIPIVTHDSDTTPGLANRIIGSKAKIHATGMPAEFYNYPKDKTRFTGIPLSKYFAPVSSDEQAKYKQAIGLPKDSQVLFISGGGNGAATINELLIASALGLLKEHPKLYILHITGHMHEQAVMDRYKAALEEEYLKRILIIGFTDELHKFSGAADLIITRAGATSIAEFGVQAKPLIVIPAPFLPGAHQPKNAAELEKVDAAVILPNDIDPTSFQKTVNDLLDDPKRRKELSANIAKLSKRNAARELAAIIINVARGREF